MKKFEKNLWIRFLFGLILCLPAFLFSTPLFEPPVFGDSSSYIKSWVESASGFKSLAEGSRAVERVLNRDVKEWRIKQIANLDARVKDARERK